MPRCRISAPRYCPGPASCVPGTSVLATPPTPADAARGANHPRRFAAVAAVSDRSGRDCPRRPHRGRRRRAEPHRRGAAMGGAGSRCQRLRAYGGDDPHQPVRMRTAVLVVAFSRAKPIPGIRYHVLRGRSPTTRLAPARANLRSRASGLPWLSSSARTDGFEVHHAGRTRRFTPWATGRAARGRRIRSSLAGSTDRSRSTAG